MQAQDLALARPHKLLLRLFIFLRKKSAAASRRALIRIRENEVAIIAIAAAAGFAVGAGVAAIGSAAALLHYVLFGVPPGSHLSAGEAIPTINAFLAPAIGGMLVGLTAATIRYLRPHEIVDPIEANALYGGRMSMWDSLNLTLITMITVSFGGSAGLEAAYTQAGSGFASKTGQAFRLRRKDLRLLVGCGSAAAISAAFNSPLTGAFYAFELVIGSYTLQSLAPVASAALCGNLAMHAIAGAEPSFEMPGAVALDGRDYVLFLFPRLWGGLRQHRGDAGRHARREQPASPQGAPLAPAHAGGHRGGRRSHFIPRGARERTWRNFLCSGRRILHGAADAALDREDRRFRLHGRVWHARRPVQLVAAAGYAFRRRGRGGASGLGAGPCRSTRLPSLLPAWARLRRASSARPSR